MRTRLPHPIGETAAVPTLIAFLTLAAVLAGEQKPSRTGAPTHERAPRTASGAPDLQGIWDFATPVPLERPTWTTKYELTEPEAVEFTRRLNKERADSESTTSSYDHDLWYADGRDRKAYYTSL